MLKKRCIIETYATLPTDKVSAYAMERFLAGGDELMMKFCLDLLKYLIIGVIAYYVIVYGFCHVVLLVADVMEVEY